jgi:molybdopterin-containing oxidoreductase family iron-sulfur binding subunit
MIIAGPDQSPAVQALAHSLNERLGAYGAGLVATEPMRLGRGDGVEPLRSLVDDMAVGRVRRLMILDCNPAYDAPADYDFKALAARVPASLHLGLAHDETARTCDFHVPMRHALESWGDLRAYDGTVGLQQPATVPLVPAVSTLEWLALLAGERPDGRALLRRQWSGLGEGDWLRALETGIVPGTEAALDAPAPPQQAEPLRPGKFTLTFQPDARMWDGRFANNAWLQELPSPLTKLVWGNAALIAPATAAELEVESGDMVEIRHRGAVAEIPAWVMPGQAPGVITLTLGHGRADAGRVGSGLGVDAYRLRSAETPWIAPGIEVRKRTGKGRVISTQHHQPVADPEAIRTSGDEGAEALPSLYPDYPSAGHAWGMVIDLDACIGCGACTISCQAENNIPVVGPAEAERGREMHWIRVDRYHEGPIEAPETHFQPVPCMHCEKAPCEVVCPVGATVHSAEGLNQMVYNRCIGTRTCSNNCPYKVRRFNWFDYQSKAPATPAPANNPRVTVRDRGVMEKCTYCVQRINAARAEATVMGRDLREGDVRTACQQACPTRAISFGDLNDPDSEVSRLRRSGRNYALLGNLGTRPRTTYLARRRRI